MKDKKGLKMINQTNSIYASLNLCYYESKKGECK